jgi:4a-hydroxytetrahydrobiopterin dehydratase
MAILTTPQLQDALLGLPDWEYKEGKLVRSFTFEDFAEALSFINKIGEVAEKDNHHPEIYNSYNIVTISLMSHEAGGITEKDVALAKKIDLL